MHRNGQPLLVCLVLLAIVCLGSLCGCRGKEVSGVVVDCGTGAGIPGVKVCAHQTGWGSQNGQLVWDQLFTSCTHSGEDGRFVIIYQVGSSAHLLASTSDYFIAEQWEDPGRSVVIRLLQEDPPVKDTPHLLYGQHPLNAPPAHSVTHNCRPI